MSCLDVSVSLFVLLQLFQRRDKVSHRFSTVRLADRIFVIENGTIIESGSHAELIALNGRYAELFDLQAEAYR